MERIKKSPYLVDAVPGLEFNPKNPDSVSCTKQSFSEEVDINNIIDKFTRTGILGNVDAIDARNAVFGDFSDYGDYQSALNRIAAVNTAFAELPVNVRAKFNHDPSRLIDFIANPANNAECIELGLLSEKYRIKKPADQLSAGAPGAAAVPGAAPVVPGAAAPSNPAN